MEERQSRDSPARRQHSPDQSMSHKRHCYDQVTPVHHHVHLRQPLFEGPPRESPSRRQHSPDREESHKRRCHELGTPPRHVEPGGTPPGLRRCGDPMEMQAGAEQGMKPIARASTTGTLRPSRSCYDLRSLDLQHQERPRARPVLHCGVQQAALDLSYLSLAMGSPSTSSSPLQQPRRTSSGSRDSFMSDVGVCVDAISPSMWPPTGAGDETHAHMPQMYGRSSGPLASSASSSASSASSASGSSLAGCSDETLATAMLGEFRGSSDMSPLPVCVALNKVIKD